MAGWRDRLAGMFRHHEERTTRGRPGKEDVRRFLAETVAPALEAVAEELRTHGREAEMETGPDMVSITVFHDGEEEFYYAVKARTYQRPFFAFPEMTFKEEREGAYHRAEVYLREGSQDYGIMGYDRERVIGNFMHEYDKQLRWQKPAHRKRP